MRSRALNLLWPLAVAAQSPPFSNGSCTGSPSTPVPYQLQTPPLDTPWTDQVGLNPWPEHPRPQLKREDWVSLNGIWTYQSAGNATEVTDVPCAPLQYETLIPSCIESAISGLQVLDTSAMWFATTFRVPPGWDSSRSVLLNFEAVDYEATVYVNGQQVSFYRGGYFRNTIDVTSYLSSNGTNEL